MMSLSTRELNALFEAQDEAKRDVVRELEKDRDDWKDRALTAEANAIDEKVLARALFDRRFEAKACRVADYHVGNLRQGYEIDWNRVLRTLDVMWEKTELEARKDIERDARALLRGCSDVARRAEREASE